MANARIVVATMCATLVTACASPDSVTFLAPDANFARNAAAGDEFGYSEAFAQAQQATVTRGGARVKPLRADLRVAAGWAGATTILANDRDRLFDVRFVENDPRRGGSPVISYLVDQSDGIALSVVPPSTVIALPNAVTEPAIDASMARWLTQTNCNPPPQVKVADPGTVDPDIVDNLLFGIPLDNVAILADITHAGWLPGNFFNLLQPGGSSFILGATIPFVFVDDDGNPTDIDRNGALDAAFYEIYYNRAFPWTTDATDQANIDIESVVTHEAGHAFGLFHFGKVFLDQKGRIKFAPQAVMNAVYVFAFRDLVGTDRSAFCTIWANVW